ncbi:MAG: UbiD family decarboxylase [Candidatus Accumulibacter sp.]|jgi:4-hydroxy-3-polyprenylbenzoate decarboxylase|nr:UbiD family decarboxylase [Accumulibacter sp.]
MAGKITDLRSAIDYLKTIPGQWAETDVEVDPWGEVSSVYKYIGAGGTVVRPTKEGPALQYNRVKGFPGRPIVIGMLASRKRVGYLLGHDPDRLGFLLADCVRRPINPVLTDEATPPCQEEVYLATDSGFDVRKIIPASTNTPIDGGPYITMGMAYAKDIETGDKDVTIHRLCVQTADEITMFFTPGARHIGAMREKAERLGKPLPISISIGVDPAIEIAAGFEPPTTPIGYDELGIAGAIRGEAVRMARCKTVDAECIAHAEYVIEGELLPNYYVREDRVTDNGNAMPEFPGYVGPACPKIPVIKVKAVTTRKNPIMQTCIGPSEEHRSMAGIPTEASILMMVERAIPGRLLNCYAHPSGGGKYLAILQFRKSQPSDEGRQRQAALLAFSAFAELKTVILVDEDVDLFDTDDVLWAMQTRYQGDVDTIFIPGVRCHPLDPSESNEYNPMIRDTGITCKTIYDATVPYQLKEKYLRAPFLDVDPAKWLPDH